MLEIAKEEKSEDYIRCILTDDEALLDPIGQLRSVYPNLMTLEFAQKNGREETEIIVDTEDIRPDELFALFYQKQNDRELDERQKELLDHIWKEVEGAE